MRHWAAGLIVGLCLVAGGAWAQTVTATVTPSSAAPALGRVVRGGSNTTFTIDAATGVVTKTGPAIRLTSGSVTTPTIAISCGGSGGGQCNSRQMRVQISASGALPAHFTQFSVGSLSCASGCTATYVGGTPTPAGSLDFNISGIGNGKTGSFKLGSEVLVPSTGVTGSQTFTVTVVATLQ